MNNEYYRGKEYYNSIVNHLRGLVSGEIEPRRKSVGLCHDLDWNFNFELHDIISTEDLLTYKYYSGEKAYPIGGGMREYVNVRDMGRGDMWDADTEYGKMRLAFCNWLADYIEEGYE